MDDFLIISQRAKASSGVNEAITAVRLVFPFLYTFGWTEEDLHLEYIAPFTVGDGKKTKDRLDIALCAEGSEPTIGIEKKQRSSRGLSCLLGRPR
jgi:hypothetical protein